jgi:hypothetical protein
MLYIRALPQNVENSKFTRGIENLLPESVVSPDFYDVRIDKKYTCKIETLNKRKLCDWIIAQDNPNLFSGFAPLIQILEEFVALDPKSSK